MSGDGPFRARARTAAGTPLEPPPDDVLPVDFDRPVGALQGREVVVAGAGVGGLAAALCLARRGARVIVLERAGALEEVGAGVQISPNGHRVLRALGLSAALEAAGERSEAVALLDGQTGRSISSLPLPGPDRANWRMLHRADLVGLLAAAAAEAGAVIRLGDAVADAALTDRRPVLETEGGERMAPDLLVGADGIRSRLRAALNPEVAPAFSGQTAWRALVEPTEPHPPEARVHLFPGRHVVSYPIRSGALVNIVAVAEQRAWAEDGWDAAGDPDGLRAAFSDAHPALGALLRAVEATHLWGLFERPVAPRWTGGGVALVGDAAHPTLPFLAQGANLALEDAWALAEEADEPASLDRGLRGYEARRRPRAMRAVKAARANARAYHLGGTPRVAAHAALRLGSALAPRLVSGRYAWLHGHDETGGRTLLAQASISTHSGV